MTAEEIASVACRESQTAHGIMGGSPYDCALRAARIALNVLGPQGENRLLHELKVNRGTYRMMAEDYTSQALHKIITEFEATASTHTREGGEGK